MGNALDLKFLQLVVAIAEEGSLTRAGKRLHLTQSALSHQLAALEERFGIEVFSRQGRQLRITPLGSRLLSRARLVVSQVEEIEAELTAPNPRQQELRLTTQCFTCYHWLPTLLASFESTHPTVTVSLVVESTREAMEALEAGAIDMAITAEDRQDPRYERRFVFEDELMIALSPNHVLAKRDYVEFADLESERLLVHPPSAADRQWFEQAVDCGAHKGPREIQRIPVTDAIIELTASGYGCALLSRLSAAHAEAQGRIALREFGPRRLTRRFHASWRRDVSKQLPLSDFAQAVVHHCAQQWAGVLPAQEPTVGQE